MPQVNKMKNIKEFFKKEAVLCVAVLLAIISCFFVHPDKEYLNYIDFRTLAILFSLMTVMAGLQKLNVFKEIAEGMLKRVKGERGLVLTLVLLAFFFSMLITNDVALITFVPFTFTTLMLKGEDTYKKLVIPVVVLQTVAANLGSMLTPIGNPQNLYLYSLSGINFFDFLKLMLPYSLISLLLIIICIYLFTAKEKSEEKVPSQDNVNYSQRKTLTEMFAESQTKYHSLLIMYLLLFIVALLVVLRVLPYGVMFFLTLILVLLSDRKTLLKVDYSLLFTFIGFFIFIGNMGRLPVFANALEKIVTGREVLTSILASQVISNVPCALLLSGFTDNYESLIVGTNLGGLGTLIASMASLISYKMVAAKENIKTGEYFKKFTLVNFVFLIILSLSYSLLSRL